MGIPVVISQNGFGLPVRVVQDNAPLMTIAENGRGTPIVLTDNGAPFVIPELITVTGGEVTTFDNGGTSYTQILFRQDGTFTSNKELTNVSYAVVGGGGSGASVGQAPGGGGGGRAIVAENTTIPAMNSTITIGQGAIGPEFGNGNNGGDTSWNGIVAEGGGGGGGSVSGMSGGNGGGAGTNSTTSELGGVGIQFDGGNSFGSATTNERAAGGGGGAGGPGQDAALNTGGNGGVGLTLAWTDGAIEVSGGGGGAAISGAHGTASHGGSPATTGVASLDGVNGGGSGGARAGAPKSGDGGDGLVVIVFPSDQAVVG